MVVRKLAVDPLSSLDIHVEPLTASGEVEIDVFAHVVLVGRRSHVVTLVEHNPLELGLSLESVEVTLAVKLKCHLYHLGSYENFSGPSMDEGGLSMDGVFTNQNDP